MTMMTVLTSASVCYVYENIYASLVCPSLSERLEQAEILKSSLFE